jgi:hypothetical protein
MSDRIEIPSGEDWDKAEAAETYPLWIPVDDTSGSRSAIVFCPACRNPGFLKGHTVDDRGVVSPSILCACGWHVFARLLDWQ